ncbi:saccharopine dehydrogenase family protein [Gordonia phthalatica]|uniref:saccharopine dehydrogenase family protein n=1 Tax=Gordonia phthalatica TaxID=1136941 RepID=UPI000785899B|nr:saccharopine dehydrogenase NADP-binding domain-containing protein [Gordonia phthalatica]
MNSNPFTATVVGGAGAMGRFAVRGIAELEAADRILIADLDLARAEQIAAAVGPIAQAVELDATDPIAMSRVFAESNVVLNAMGPFAKFGTPILQAALDAHCDYIDIDDDWQSTVEAFELDEQARNSGLRVVIGLGASPGTTNICARIAASRLDTVDDLFTGWSLASAVTEPEADVEPGGAAAAEHWLLQCTGKIKVWQAGRLADVRPLERVDFDFPGLGSTSAYTMGHPEPVTLPRTFPQVSRSLNLQCGPEALFTGLRQVAAAVEAGELTVEAAVELIHQREEPTADPSEATLPDLFALAVGSRAGVRTSVAVQPAVKLRGKMGGHTGYPLAIGVHLLRTGGITATGVNAPEAAVDPEEFFAAYLRLAGDTSADSGYLINESPSSESMLS